MTRAMLLCAGYGTRLGALSTELAKPLLPVCDVAIVRYGIALCVGHGIRDIVINLHHNGALFERELGDGSSLGARIQYTHEDPILGTGGGLKNALALLDPDGDDEPFVSMNGKLIFDLDLEALLAAHRADADALGTLVVRKNPDPVSFGAVDVETSDSGPNRVRNILGAGDYMFCGVHVTRPSVMQNLPDGEACSIRQGYLPWIHAGGQVGAHIVGDEYFAEHSTAKRYLDSNVALLGKNALRHPPGVLCGVSDSAHVASSALINQPVRIGDGAHIGENATVGPHTVIGAHAIVEEGARVERSVVWTGARVTESVSNAIVTAESTVDASSEP